MSTEPNRQPPGTPKGGEFTHKQHGTVDTDLGDFADRPEVQTNQRLRDEYLSLNAFEDIEAWASDNGFTGEKDEPIWVDSDGEPTNLNDELDGVIADIGMIPVEDLDDSEIARELDVVGNEGTSLRHEALRNELTRRTEKDVALDGGDGPDPWAGQDEQLRTEYLSVNGFESIEEWGIEEEGLHVHDGPRWTDQYGESVDLEDELDRRIARIGMIPVEGLNDGEIARELDVIGRDGTSVRHERLRQAEIARAEKDAEMYGS